MFKKSKRSKEEIAKEFDLPERKSKIATILKQGEQYCLCRSSDCSRFMIGCDGCEEWYHGDCIFVSEKEAKHIKHYYCQRCKENDPSLQTVFRAVPVAAVPSNPSDDRLPKKPKEKVRESDAKEGSKSKGRCGNCDGCSNKYNCGRCDSCRSTGKKQRCDKRICINQRVKKEKPATSRTKKRRRSPSPEITNPELEGPRQCYGPGCRMTARPQSKYCSDLCGKKLASSRIYQVLPQRIQEWNLSPCIAEEENKVQLDNIRAKKMTVRATLAQLDERQKELDLLVERAKRCVLDPNASETNEVEDEMSMYCVTCGFEIHSRTAIRHMEKCFNKYESQASFGSIFKTRIEGSSMFCDFYNPASKTYCKRLRVLCPEHCKKPKISDTDVCGCPLVKNTFELTGEFCCAPKKKCFRHFFWEKIRRAEIDCERVRQWLKMDELMEQERQVRSSMASRAGVLHLMLHSTYNHELMEQLCRSGRQ
ncbi:CXXC-type zinc finger protein 1-like [Bradysia coprophila]|uniref:CXXC-type zinc finger protein 1-like n=1 Tax=Bradysia coprophila TaxID=38358 RepID=UPI00187D8D53|nr:CXXC-type zinc finger protein 1-like [Bradysia coprophila]